MSVDPFRRVGSSRPVGRVLSGQDRFEKEALEGPPEGHLAMDRRQRMAGGPLPVNGESPFAAKMRKLAASNPDGKED
ncbi:hypothetical protein HRD49_14255 [Corallococcus exiguus]|uniref:Uncharacterized protein n=1 Tax=Corallococcus exiguus TaxID=83462 RepID=A0A7Y1WW81_9BACT|nr:MULTISPECIES: hypothetical protein [Corallococcus]RKI44848.1 hypothetical protein D7Y27_12215 [Corallococcus sp. AB004]NBC42453.1 hypothetical protein [Corallococcus exiguus]NNB87785.1 hypothetical protein [Corallococcus exiguus]NNB94902.1 hypothetical protein [Corallococcus exiguus]NNC02603.1 hypothetical protein [Corallococcus exiguus]